MQRHVANHEGNAVAVGRLELLDGRVQRCTCFAFEVEELDELRLVSVGEARAVGTDEQLLAILWRVGSDGGAVVVDHG